MLLILKLFQSHVDLLLELGSRTHLPRLYPRIFLLDGIVTLIYFPRLTTRSQSIGIRQSNNLVISLNELQRETFSCVPVAKESSALVNGMRVRIIYHPM
jgi:hypothetical protein